jgi:thioesterase domain-containing protein
MKNNVEIFRDFTPGRFDGVMTLFVATLDLGAEECGIRAEGWEPHVGGVRVHEVACAHHDMLRPEHAAVIGKTVSTEL